MILLYLQKRVQITRPNFVQNHLFIHDDLCWIKHYILTEGRRDKNEIFELYNIVAVADWSYFINVI